MKACTRCYRLFFDQAEVCPVDGQGLLPTSEVTPPTDEQDSRVGSMVCQGRYQVWRRVADGGMGRVYQAHDIEAGRPVAMKILHPEVALDNVSLERFKREFAVSTSLPHDYIVEVLAFEHTEDNSFALVMEYLEGEELRTVLKRVKTLPPERIVRILSQVALGLDAAHKRNFVHRDLKPDNIFLCSGSDGDWVKILDFGSVRDNSQGAKKLTIMGTTIGSPYYMSPEQAQGLEELDHRADVWSLAAIAYECLTGKVPFEGATGPAILLAIMTEQPLAASEAGKAQNVPKTLNPVFEEALEKKPAGRTASISALADRIGAAYGLVGTHAEWARLPQSELADGIRAALPAALDGFEQKAKLQLAAMNQAIRSDDAFMAGSIGGPMSAPPNEVPEDVAMGVPKGMPGWLIPLVAGIAIGLGIFITILLSRR